MQHPYANRIRQLRFAIDINTISESYGIGKENVIGLLAFNFIIRNGGKFFPPTVVQRAFAQTKIVMHYLIIIFKSYYIYVNLASPKYAVTLSFIIHKKIGFIKILSSATNTVYINCRRLFL